MAVVLINVTTQMVTSANLLARAYPSDGDTIGIPILSTLFLSVIASPWLLLIAFFSRIRAIRTYFSSGGIRSALVIAGIAVLYVPAILLTVGGIDYWAIPRHYEIAVAFGISLLVLILLAWDDFRTLRSNPAMDSDTVRSPLRAPYGARHRER